MKGGAACPAIGVAGVQLKSELEDGAPLGDRGRVYRRADVLLDPLGSASRGLVRAGLVFADRHSHTAIAASNRCVAGESRHPADEGLHVFLALREKVKELRGPLP